MSRALGLRIPSILMAVATCASCANLNVRLGPDQIDIGLGYWKYGVGSRPIYSLHWVGNTVSVSDGYENADIFTIAVSECAGLDEARIKLLRDVHVAITELVDGVPTPPPEEVIADAGLHRLVYHPQAHSNHLELSGFDGVPLQPWIKSAEALRKIVRGCRDS
jgi:hypothetical protein